MQGNKIASLVHSSLSNLRGIDRQTKLDVFWVGIIQAANYLFPFLATTYLVRTIGVDLYGRTEFATLTILYYVTLVNYEFHITGTRSFSRALGNPSKIGNLFNLIFASKTLLLVLSTGLFFGMESLWPARFANHLFLFSYLIVIGHFFYQPHIFQGLGKVRALAVMNFLIKAVSTGILFIIIRSRNDYQLVNLNYSLSYILIGLVSYCLAIKLFSIRLQWKKWRAIRLYLKSGFYIFLTNGVIAQLSMNLSAVLLGFFLKPSILGSYSAALKIVIAFQVMILFPIRQVFFPKLSAYWINDRAQYRSTFKSYILLLGGSTLALGLALVFAAPVLIRVIYGDYYPMMIDSMRLLAFLPFFTALNTIFIIDGLIVMGKDRLVFHIQSVIAVVNIVVLLFMVPRYGLGSVLIMKNLLELSACIAGFFYFKKLNAQYSI